SPADAGDLGQHLAPRGLADLVRGLIQDLFAAGADRHPGALRGELLGGGATEPFASAGDDGDLPVQTELEHDRILLAGLSIDAGAPGPHPNTSRVRSGAGTAGGGRPPSLPPPTPPLRSAQPVFAGRPA